MNGTTNMEVGAVACNMQRQGDDARGTAGPANAGPESGDAGSESTAESLWLPEHPLLVIEPTKGWAPLCLGELWAYRELLYFLVWRDVKVRYKQTALGAVWAILQPLCLMLIFSLFFGNLAGIPSDDVPYALFAFAGLLPWLFFAHAVNNGANSVVGNAQLITKTYFPRMLLPISAMGAGAADFLVGLGLLAGLMAYFETPAGWGVLFIPLLLLLLAALACGVATGMAALNVSYRDVRYALPFLIQLWMFASPVIYPATIVPERWRWLLELNPLTGILDGFRAALFDKEMPWRALGASTIATVVVCVCSTYIFRRMERDFADLA